MTSAALGAALAALRPETSTVRCQFHTARSTGSTEAGNLTASCQFCS